MLRPVERTRVSQSAVDQIVDLIRLRQLEPGDKLPGERQLVAQLEVGRTSVREALRALEAMGLIEVRPGIGTFVKHPVSDLVDTALPHPLLLNLDALKNLFELREIIETSAITTAAVRATADDLKLIRKSVEQMESCYEERDLEGMVTADTELHKAILVATGNDILISLMDNIADLLREMRRASLSISEGVKQSIAGHRAILTALEQRQPEAARQAMQAHLKTVASKIDSVEITKTGDVYYKNGNPW